VEVPGDEVSGDKDRLPDGRGSDACGSETWGCAGDVCTGVGALCPLVCGTLATAALVPFFGPTSITAITPSAAATAPTAIHNPRLLRTCAGSATPTVSAAACTAGAATFNSALRNAPAV